MTKLETERESEELELVPVAEAQRKLGGVGRTTVWRLGKQGELTIVNIGSRAFVTKASLTAKIRKLIEEAKKISAQPDTQPSAA
jgi:hypothetical protein